MNHPLHYSTVSQAIETLRKQGFTLDFNLEENCLVCDNKKFTTTDFEIVDVYRYEGDTDPADEASVYAIESKNGLKGILVTGYGPSADSMSAALLDKLKWSK
ncbi:MAG TPA: hypothetical protein PK289_05410 [Bacteroidia bacterium]|jgi:hypothetical protein|nr:hypothetical protein [Bacteroidia bacterium]HRG52780.1 hypothetical protein [Bacteroidia bacterium]